MRSIFTKTQAACRLRLNSNVVFHADVQLRPLACMPCVTWRVLHNMGCIILLMSRVSYCNLVDRQRVVLWLGPNDGLWCVQVLICNVQLLAITSRIMSRTVSTLCWRSQLTLAVCPVSGFASQSGFRWEVDHSKFCNISKRN